LRILVVEDDPSLLDAIVTLLREESYQVDQADNGPDGLYLAEQCIHELMILDVMLPGMDGLSVLSSLRSKGITMPVLLLTARDSVVDRVNGLDSGADDYLVKPFASPELLARMRVLLRRQSGGAPAGELNFGDLSVKCQNMEGYARGKPLKLTLKEFELMEFLLLNREQILTKEQLLDRVWGIDSGAGLGVIDVYIHYLRKKLAVFDCERYIHTVRGVGYMLKEKS